MPARGEVLIAILNNLLDFAILREQGWYRIPVGSVEKWLKDRWPPQWLAFYQTKAFGEEAHAVRYFARVRRIQKAQRWQLFPDEPRNDARSGRSYYQVFVEPLQRLNKPIYSRRWRRIVFIPTTWQKFCEAAEINDLYAESSLEDRLWEAFKQRQIPAERQEFVVARGNDYALDFAIYCNQGKIDVETDGDFWHANPERAKEDNRRDNDLKTAGWKVLRFGSQQIQEETEEYCMATIVQNIHNLGGLDDERVVPRRLDIEDGQPYQLSLFDDL